MKRTDALIIFYGSVGISLLIVLERRQRALLRRVESVLLQIEQESRATAHMLGADTEILG